MRQPGRWFWLPLALVIAQHQLGAAEKHPAGREIFLQQCAKCHGRRGEGVKGKYEGPLQGERPLEKLTRYIERNMPDDHPGTCTGADAAAVARFIYDTFYSKEARLRSNKPPRVELARLTNQQYLNSVADIFKEFTGGDSPPSEQHGLQATYYSWKDFAGDKKALERIDRTIDFDYVAGFPDEKVKSTNGFSMQWRGSLKPDDTGEYEFILKTPNGARLWVNDESEPLIDGWVASGQVSEQKAKLRLIGGRVYPLRLDYFKHKEKVAGISLQWRPPHGAQQPIAARNLMPSGASPTFVVSTPFPPDDSSLGYERGMSVSKAWDEATTAAAIEVATYLTDHLDRLSGSKPGDTNREAKIETFCVAFVSAAFRRPLTEQQKRLYVTAQLKRVDPKNQKPANKDRTEAGKNDPSANKVAQAAMENGVKRVVLLTLKSPRFLYPGLEGPKPDDFDVATRLSFSLWDSIPDRELRQAAAQGSLRTPEHVLTQARRMLNDPRAHAKMLSFFHHWLQMDRVENLPKDEKLFPDFSPAIIADLRSSLDIFLEETMWGSATVLPRDPPTDLSRTASSPQPSPPSAVAEALADKKEEREKTVNPLRLGASDYRTLLLADYLFLNNRLARFYGVSTNATDDFVKTRLDPETRSGVLTHPYLLSAFSYRKMTSPIHRGVFLTRNIVGRSLKPPPMAMTFKVADFAPNLTMRQKVAELTSAQNCQSCHSVINPLGFSLEQFDAIGRFRTSDNFQPIDATSEYVTDDGQTVRLAGARDVAKFAIGSEPAQDAFIQQLFHHIVKQPMLAYGPDTLTRLRQDFLGSDFNMQRLLLEVATTAALRGLEKTGPEQIRLSADRSK